MNPVNPADPSALVTLGEPLNASENPKTGALADGKKTSWLAVIALAVIAVGFWYYYAYYGSVSPDLGGGAAAAVPRRPEPPKDEATTMLQQQQSSSDAVSDIESDLNATDLNGLDRELSDIESGL